MAKANIANTLIVPEDTKVFPFYDDYDESKNFHRVLFRPGYAVQGRELTQLQTILQNQIERFGRHIFVNGSSVIGGDILIPDSTFTAIKLKPEFNGSAIDVSKFKDKVLVLFDNSSNVKFRVIHYTEATDVDPPTVYGNYFTNETFRSDFVIKIENEDIFAETSTGESQYRSKLAFMRDSIFFFNGFFIKVPSQVAVIGKYTPNPSCKVGLEYDERIITENEDTSLLDPAQESFNYQAPGAARYSSELILSSRALDSEDDSKFIELARVENGIIRKLTKFPIYSEIEEVLARRTFDESGNYTVKPFLISFDDDRTDPTNFVQVNLSPGKAYILGYEFETVSQTTLRLPKARTKNIVTEFDLNMNYGNYVIVNDLNGVFDTSKMEMYDIHCVPYQFVDFSSLQNYNRTKIGTGRIKDLEFFGNNPNRYEFYIFDTRFTKITTNVVTTTANTMTLFGDNLSANDQAYLGATLRIIDGPGSGYNYTISSYDGSTQNVGITLPFSELPDNTSNVSIEFDFGQTESFVIHKDYTAGATANANTNINLASKNGGIPDEPAFVFEPSLATLVFSLPENYIANDINNTSYTYRKKYTTSFVSGTSNPIVSGENEQFVGATSTSNTSSTSLNNFLVICTDKKTSARANGDIIAVAPTVTTGAPEVATFFTGNTDINDSFDAVVFSKMEFDRGVLPKTKEFVSSNTLTFSSETPSTTFSNPTGSNTTVYLNAAQIVIENPTRQVGVPESLFISDVISVVRIFDLAGQALPSGGDSLRQYNEVTNRFDFDNGQRDTHYDHASIKLKPNFAPCVGPLIVCVNYYKHTYILGQGGYFSVDSYPNLFDRIVDDGVEIGDGYSIIPKFKNFRGDTIELRDSIDFRPKRENASNVSPNFNLTGILVPVSTTDFELDYQYYLGRKDLIVLNANKSFELIEGVPAKRPQEPTIPSRSMVLYSLIVPPYTEYSSNVNIKYIDNKRYTMRDIGKIEKRVENLEYYVTLNALEKNALDLIIPDVNGLNRTKFGIFVDSFTGHLLGDKDRDDYVCAMNFKEGWLQNRANTIGFDLEANLSLSTGVTFHRDKVTLNYSEREFLSQPNATKDAPVAEFLYAVFDGNIITLPEADIWKSTTESPDIIFTDTANNEYTSVNIYESVVDSQSRTT